MGISWAETGKACRKPVQNEQRLQQTRPQITRLWHLSEKNQNIWLPSGPYLLKGGRWALPWCEAPCQSALHQVTHLTGIRCSCRSSIIGQHNPSTQKYQSPYSWHPLQLGQLFYTLSQCRAAWKGGGWGTISLVQQSVKSPFSFRCS